MSLLDHLWDDTVAGPMPETGLGELRKSKTFANRQKDSGNVDDGVKVSRSIMITKPQALNTTESLPISPAGSLTPGSPFSGERGGFWFRRKPISEVYEKANGIRPGSPRPPHDL